MTDFQSLIMAADARLGLTKRSGTLGTLPLADVCETLIDIAKHFDARLAAFERANEPKTPANRFIPDAHIPVQMMSQAAADAARRDGYEAGKCDGRNEALEEAAAHCEAVAKDCDNAALTTVAKIHGADRFIKHEATSLRCLASVIRALKSTPSK